MRRPAFALAVALAAAPLGPAAASATANALTHNPANALTAAVLTGPGAPTSVHATVSGSGAGGVTLTWAPAATSWTQSYVVERAPATTGTPSWSTVGTVAASTCTSTCSYTDAAQYGQQYLYRVDSQYKSWTTASGQDAALSLQPVTQSAAGTATDTTKYGISEQAALPTAGSQPGQLAGGASGDNHVYVVEQGGGRIARVATANGAPVELLLNAGWTASGITVDAADSGNVYFTENAAAGSRVGRLVLASLGTCPVTSGQISYTTLTSCGGLVEWTVSGTANVGLRGIAGDSTRVYFAEYTAGKLGLIKISNGSLGSQVSAGTGPLGVVIPSFDTGNVYFTESGSNQIGKAQANASLNGRADSAAIAGSAPAGIAGGPDGNLWFTESGTGRVAKMATGLTAPTEYTVPSAGSAPNGIALGADGNLWFAEGGTSRVAAVTSSGTFTEYATPTVASAPAGVAAGPDGHVWFSESAAAANRVALVTSAATYALDAADVSAAAVDGDALAYQTGAWAATASTSTYSQAVTLVPAAPAVPTGSAVTSVRVVLDYQMPAAVAGQTNTAAGLRVGISADGGRTYTTYPLPNPQQTSPSCPSPGVGATETCTFSAPSALVELGVPASVAGTVTRLSQLLVQVQAAPGSGSAFALTLDLVHVDVN